MITEKDFRAAFRQRVDDEADELLRAVDETATPATPAGARPDESPVRLLGGPGARTGRGPWRSSGSRRPGWGAALVAAAAVVVIAGVAAVLSGRLTDERPDPAAPTPTDVAVVRLDEPVPGADLEMHGTLEVVDGCLALDSDMLVAVSPSWLWEEAEGTLRWVPSSQSEPYRIGDTLRVAGTNIPANRLRADGVELPASCADHRGTVLLLGSPVTSGDDYSWIPSQLDLTASAGAHEDGHAELVTEFLPCRWTPDDDGLVELVEPLVGENPGVFSLWCLDDAGMLEVGAVDVAEARALLDGLFDERGTAPAVRDSVRLVAADRSMLELRELGYEVTDVLERWPGDLEAELAGVDLARNAVVARMRTAPDDLRRALYERFGDAVVVYVVR